MKVARFPLAGSLQTRQSTATVSRDQYFQNCFVITNTDELSQGRRIRLIKRDGFASVEVDGSNLTRADLGSIPWTGATTPQLAFSFWNGTTTMRFYNESATQIGSGIANTNSCLHLTETTISGTANLVATVTDSASGLKEVWYFPEGGAWTQITDTEFPPNQTPAIAIIGPPAHMDGYMFQMTTTGQIWNSDLNSVSAWSANNFIAAQMEPDSGMGLAVQKNYIIAFGTRSIEFFRNAGNPSGSPLASVNGSLTRIGAASSQIRTIGDSVYFVGLAAGTTELGAYRINGTTIEKISSPDVDVMLDSGGVLGGFKTSEGYEHVMFSGVTTGYRLCFCITTKRWWIWYSTKGTVRSIWGSNANTRYSHLSMGDGSYGVANPTIGSMLVLTSVFQDGTEAMTATAQLQALDFGTNNRKFWKYLRLSGDKQTSTTTVTVSYSDDDGVNFTTAGTIDMSVSPPDQLTRLGASRRRVWKFSNATNTPLSLDQVEIGYEVGPT